MSLAAALAWRYGIGAALLVALAGGPRATALPGSQVPRLLLLGGGGQVAIAIASLSALRYGLSAAMVTFLFYTYPAWVTVFAALRGERLTRARAVALALSLAGIVVMVGAPGTSGVHPVGVALELTAAILYALYIPFLGRLQGGASPSAASVWVTAGASAMLAAWALSRGELAPPPSAPAWTAVLVLGGFSTAVAFVLFLRGLAALGPVRTAIVSTVEPFWSALFGALLLRQPVGPATVAGGALIAAAVVVLSTAGTRARDAAPGPTA
jgi:drug/metabolite transporter (DMT)-like permease